MLLGPAGADRRRRDPWKHNAMKICLSLLAASLLAAVLLGGCAGADAEGGPPPEVSEPGGR